MTFLVPLIGIACGILLGMDLKSPFWGAIPIMAALAYYLYLLKKCSYPGKSIRLNPRHYIWIFLLFLGTGIFNIWFHAPTELPKDDHEKYIAAEGEVKSINTFSEGDVLTVDIHHLIDNTGTVTDRRNLKVIVYTDGVTVAYGDIVAFPFRLKEISDNPNYRPSGYAERMKRKGIIYKCHLNNSEIKINGYHNSILAASSRWRDKICVRLENSSLHRNTSEFLIAIVLGDKSLLSPEIKESFSSAGVAHVLALSGMHVAIIMGMFILLFYPLRFMGHYRLSEWLAVIMLWGFAFFTGFAPSTVRACIMATFVVLAMQLEKKNRAENALLAAAFVILLIEPYYIFDIGMQLSFLCVASILIFTRSLNLVERHLHPNLYAVNSAIIVSMTSTLATWTLVSYYFKKIPLLFLPVNLLMLPLLPPFLWVSVIYILALLAGIDIIPLAWIINNAYELFVWISNTFSFFGKGVINYQVSASTVIIWIIGLALVGYSIKRKMKTPIILSGIVIMASSVLLSPILKTNLPDNIIFQRNHEVISLAIYDTDEEKITTLPRNTISRVSHKGHEIIAIDCKVHPDSLPSILTFSEGNKSRYIIIGSGATRIKLKDIPNPESYEKIILHSSIKRKMEQSYKKEALEIGLNRVYSLREEGPLNVEV